MHTRPRNPARHLCDHDGARGRDHGAAPIAHDAPPRTCEFVSDHSAHASVDTGAHRTGSTPTEPECQREKNSAQIVPARALSASLAAPRKHAFALPRARAFLIAGTAFGSASSTSFAIAFFRSAHVAPSCRS